MDENGKINSQEEYNKEFKLFHDKLKYLTQNPHNFLIELDKLFNHAETIGLLAKEDIDKFKNRILNSFRRIR